jgi:hypothetical protein
MNKKVKFSKIEKEQIRNAVVSIMIQLLIILAFIRMLALSRPVDISDTREIDITVDNTYHTKFLKDYMLIIESSLGRYTIYNNSRADRYSVDELYKIIKIGDSLSLSYYESFGILGKTNCVIEARSADDVYRSYDEYYNAKQGVDIFVIILFAIVELIFAGIVFINVWINKKEFKDIFSKIKRKQ